VIDFWAFIQVGLLCAISARAIWRLSSAQSIRIPKQVRSIYKMAFFLGLLFLASSVYSTSRLVSAAYSILYILTMICVVEFIVDANKYPPNWMQCLFHLRLIALLLFVAILLTLTFYPSIVMAVIPGVGIRLGGGAVAPVTVICPMIAIISAYTFLHSLESRARSVLFFMVGLTGTLITQGRGCEFALFLSFAILGIGWAKTGRRSAYVFISGLMASILLSGMLLGAIGGGRIWNTFNRGQNAQDIASASGRTQVWNFVIQYCLAHPQGMGYIAGFRTIFRQYFTLGLRIDVTGFGNAHNVYMQVLADAGWLALAIYLIMMVKIVSLGWRFAKKRALVTFESDSVPRHAIQCALVLLIFYFADGMDAADFSLPLRAAFYMQNIIIAIILGASASMLTASRARSIASVK